MWIKKYDIDTLSSYNCKTGQIVLKDKKRLTLNQNSRKKLNELILDYANSEHTHKKMIKNESRK